MGFATLMSERWLFGLGAVFVLSSIITLILNKQQREAALGRLGFRRRRASGASTPPRSVSPKKDAKQSGPTKPDYTAQFPPSRRSALTELAKKVTDASGKVLAVEEPASDFLLKDSLPFAQSFALQNDTPKYTPTGFSTAEVKAMGDFPEYDVLSGVPLPKEYKEFNPATALPRPYRPFRWAYHQTMSFNKMESDWWLEIDKDYVATIEKRKGIYKKYGKMILQYLPGSELACKELMEMCLQFYCARFPKYFSISADKKTFCNGLLKEDTDLTSLHPLVVLLNNVPEDFAIVLRNEENGMYYFRAGVICSSLGWNVGTKIGMELDEIHQPIPDYKEKMSFSMDRYFSKMPTNTPIQRGSWGLEVGTPLFMPPGDPHEKLRGFQKEDLKIEDCYLRVDWQTLRRLPLSAGIVFNFTALFTPVQEFRDERYVPSIVKKILTEGKKSLMEYKNTWHVEHVVIPKLEAYEQEQMAKGWMGPESEGEMGWKVATLEEYPYFPGWEDKWHRQQGY
ncbi:hypothetical protein BP6252_02558 [Coleophoma cylindrospora]|uniref:Alpha-1,2-mannosyltransferase n=1 Tax=Coleophoma cylindrospora TaxID=1849047 RepID=A0A3D8SGT3_9HELO|nr:hypothetical protein BP6252_02558 [Coleophoma cylindrospora]